MPKQGMSNDRVEFIMPMRYQTRNANKEAYVDIVMIVFGLTLSETEQAMECERVIRCRPSQFARFIIKRDAAGYCNDMKGLRMQLVPEEPQPQVLNLIAHNKPDTSARFFTLTIANGKEYNVQLVLRRVIKRMAVGLNLLKTTDIIMYKSHFASFIEELWRDELLTSVHIEETDIPADDGVLDVSDRAWS